MLNQSTGVEFNSTGYLVNFDAWSKEFAVNLAKENGLDLTDCHWLIINFLRDYYTEYGIPPEPRIIIKNLSKQIDPECTLYQETSGRFVCGGWLQTGL